MTGDNRKISTVVCVAAIILLLIAANSRVSYGFYTLLRLVVCGTAAYYAWRDWNPRGRFWPILFAAIALLFNPVVPIHFTRAEWRPVDWFIAGIFAVWVVLDWRRAGQTES